MHKYTTYIIPVSLFGCKPFGENILCFFGKKMPKKVLTRDKKRKILKKSKNSVVIWRKTLYNKRSDFNFSTEKKGTPRYERNRF